MFVASNTYFAYQDHNYKNFFIKNDCITLIVDASLIAVAIAFLSQTGLTWNPSIIIGGGTLILALDILMINKKLTYCKETLRIRQTPTCITVPDRKWNALKTPCHRIMEGIFLGSCHAFVQTTGLSCKDTDNQGVPIPLDTTNPMRFDTVITVCPLNSVFGQFIDLGNMQPEDFEKSFKKNAIAWHHVGKMAADHPSYWEALIFDCTLPDTELGKKTLLKCGMEESEYIRIVEQKKNAIIDVPIENWFKPIFEEIDKGVFGSKNVLVHCQAGISRSATVLAAYLISRFDVTTDQAINFLTSKRMCVKSKFLDGLKDYEKALAAARMPKVKV